MQVIFLEVSLVFTVAENQKINNGNGERGSQAWRGKPKCSRTREDVACPALLFLGDSCFTYWEEGEKRWRGENKEKKKTWGRGRKGANHTFSIALKKEDRGKKKDKRGKVQEMLSFKKKNVLLLFNPE